MRVTCVGVDVQNTHINELEAATPRLNLLKRITYISPIEVEQLVFLTSCVKPELETHARILHILHHAVLAHVGNRLGPHVNIKLI